MAREVKHRGSANGCQLQEQSSHDVALIQENEVMSTTSDSITIEFGFVITKMEVVPQEFEQQKVVQNHLLKEPSRTCENF